MSDELELARRATAQLRADVWLLIGDTAWRFVRPKPGDKQGFFAWFAHGAYRKAVEAQKAAATPTEKEPPK